jgi:hypothetical protein
MPFLQGVYLPPTLRGKLHNQQPLPLRLLAHCSSARLPRLPARRPSVPAEPDFICPLELFDSFAEGDQPDATTVATQSCCVVLYSCPASHAKPHEWAWAGSSIRPDACTHPAVAPSY